MKQLSGGQNSNVLPSSGANNYAQNLPAPQVAHPDQGPTNSKRSTSNPRGKSGGRRIISNGSDSNQNSTNPSNSNQAIEGGNLKKFSQHLYKHTEQWLNHNISQVTNNQ